jgi:hypothetical protein
MASYYGLSTLMISATAAEDSSKGILKPRNTLCSPCLGERKTLYLCQNLLGSSIMIDRSVLGTRGWAAQERILAPRILHYTRQQMIWECAEGLFYEALSDATGNGFMSAKYNKSECQRLVTEALSQEDTRPHCQDHNAKIQERSPENIFLHRTVMWIRCVESYSSRSLTVPTDKLHAIAGVARMLNHSGQLGEYLAGIWSAHLAIGLAWTRDSGNSSSPPLYTAPSWSWASVEGGVRYDPYPQTPFDDAHKSWARRFYPKLIEHHMVLQNQHNVYGAVLEGSYITMECACLTHADFGRFLGELYRIQGDSEISFDREDRLNILVTYDCCMYLEGDAAHESIHLLLLRWIDREASIAQRVGIVQIVPPWRTERDGERFIRTIEAVKWERWTLKLV